MSRSLRRFTRVQSKAGYIVTAILLLVAAFIVLTTLATIVLAHRSVPQADEWNSLELYGRILRQGTAWPDLFELHNEHRIFFPRLVLFSDYLFFGGRGLFDEAVIVAVQALHLALFVWLIGRSGVGRAARLGLGAVVAVFLFSLQQGENFVWAFQVQFVGVFACASLCCTLFAFGLAAEREGRRSGRYLAGAIGLALVDTFTMANGLLVGLVLVIVAVLARAPLRLVVMMSIVAAALVLLFSLGFHFDDYHPSTLDLLRNVPAELVFAAGYLAKLTTFDLPGKVVFGAAGIAALLGTLAAVALERGSRPVPLALAGIAVFAAGSAAMTALGRASHGLGEIEASRYATGAATFWAATLLNGWILPRGGLVRPAVRVAVSAAALVCLVDCLKVQMPMFRAMEDRAAYYSRVEDALRLGLLDAPALDDAGEPAFLARSETPLLRRLALSIFATSDAGQIGRPLSDVEAPGAQPMSCAGGFAKALANPDLGPDGVAVSGTSGVQSRLGQPGRIYLVDGERRIVGFAHTTPSSGRWAGYALARPGAELGAWAVSDAGRACNLGMVAVSSKVPGG